ncbi:MAG: hypothetical protein JW740_03510 [Candidatus Zambryskibacteria bacterium]|nr:hypothetical protein [Candidatus Zambryskibacteria bacterium]
MRAMGVPESTIDYVWSILPALLKYEYIVNAASFFRESIIKVWMSDEDVQEMMVDKSDLPISKAEGAGIETSYQNAFKSIEAIIGEPSKEENKLKQQLIKQGINPDEIVGYKTMEPGKEKVLEKIKIMQINRDKKAAHGKTNTGRDIGYCELKDKQELARYIILKNIAYKLKENEKRLIKEVLY